MVTVKLSLTFLIFFFGINLNAQDSVLLLETFDNTALPGWTITDDPEPRQGPSDWSVRGGELLQRSNIWSYDPPAEFIYHMGTHTITGNSEWEDYSLNAVLRSSDNDGIGLLFRYQDPGNYYRILLMNDAGNSASVNSPIQRIQKIVNGEPETLLQNIVTEAYPDGYFSLSVDARSDTLRVYLNGYLLGEVRDNLFENGKIGLMTYANTGAVFDSVMVSEERVIYDEPERSVQYPVLKDRLPYVQHPQEDRVQFAWRSLEPSIGRIEFGHQKGMPDRFLEYPEGVRKHHFELENLEPDTRYFYTVFNNNEKIVEDASFKTSKPSEENSISFFVLGDSGVGNEAQKNVSDQLIRNHNRNAADLLLHVGDVHQQAGDEYDSIYFDIYQPLLQELGFFLAIGNHDTYTDGGGPFLDSFSPPGTNGHPDGRYYWHSWGNSFFLNIDTNIDFAEGSPQYDFIVKALNSLERAELDWTFVYFHHPPYSEYWPQWDGDQRVRDHLVPLFEAQGVDMVFNGHTHSYERGILGKVHYIVSGGGGGNLDPFGRDFAHVDFSIAKHHFIRLDITGLKLQMTAIDASGSVFDTLEINKEQPVALQDAPERPDEIDLYQNYPNPFNPATRIRYKLPTAGP
ncbi:MAG: metallophosphoesterase family protein, partial [Balneolaceae bacterium]|nr:metallophosphoesterase family protein [Balneolaceae bacterium]